MSENKISIVIHAIDRATAPIKAINATIARMAAPARATSRALSGLVTQTGFRKVSKAASDVGKSFDKMMISVRSVAAVGAVAIGALGGMFYALGRFSAGGDDAVKASQRFGTTIEEWQNLSYAAELADVSAEDLGQSLGQLNKRAVAAATGNQEMATWFQRAGISVKDQNGHVKSSATLLGELADRFAAMPDGPKKLALANGLLEDSQGKLIPFLNGGSKALREAADEAVAMGLVDKQLAIDKAKLNDELKKTRAGIRGVGDTIGAAFLPSLNEMLPGLRKWIGSNRELIRSRATEWAKGLSEALPDIASGLGFVGGAILWVIQQVNKIVQVFGGWGTVIAALGGLMAGKLIWSILMFAKSIKTLGLVMTVTPFGLFMIACAALAGIAFLVIKNWDKVSAWFSNFIDGVLGPVHDMMESIQNLVSKFRAPTITSPPVKGISEAMAGRQGNQRSNQFGGKIQFEMVGAPVRVKKLESSDGLELEFDSGLLGY